MTEKEVQDIVAEELTGKTGKDSREALMNAYYKIASQLWVKFAKDLLSAEVWEMMLATSYSKSRLCLLRSLPAGGIATMQERLMKDIVFLYEHWDKVFCYLYDNYENLKYEKFRELWTKEQILENKNIARMEHDVLKCELAENELHLNLNDLPAMWEVLTWFEVSLVGKEIFLKYAEELNGLLNTFRKSQEELIPVR